MDNHNQIEKLKDEIHMLEEYAIKDSSLTPPITEVEIAEFFDETVEGIFSDDPHYWVKETPPGAGLGYDDPFHIQDLKKLHLHQKESEKTLTDRIAFNEGIYFSKAKKTISLVEKGVNDAENGDEKEAIASFKLALQTLPGKNYGQLTASLYFNLGKSYFEEGNIETGLRYFIKYCEIQNDADYYKAALTKRFQFEYKRVNIQGESQRVIKGGTLIGKKFEVAKGKPIFKKPIKVDNSRIYLDYKIPVNLEIEMKEKENILLLDYQYLARIHKSLQGYYLYEILLPLCNFSDFMNEFYGTLLEYELSITLPNDLNTLYTELFVGNKLQESLKYYEQKKYTPLHEFKSIALIKVPFEKNHHFLEDYKQFLSLFVLKQKTEKELVQEEIEKIKQQYLQQEKFELEQLWMQYEAEYYHHLKTREEYAKLCLLLYNLENGIPHDTDNKEIYNQAKSHYLKLLGNAFAYLQTRKKRGSGVFAYLNIHHDQLDRFIENQWAQMQKIIEIDCVATLQRARVVIEAIIEEIFIKRGSSASNLDLRSKIEKIDWSLNDDIRAKLVKLRFKGNKSNHYEEIKRSYFGKLEIITKEQAIQNLTYLKETIIYLIQKFQL
jgi:hypothetical protein